MESLFATITSDMELLRYIGEKKQPYSEEPLGKLYVLAYVWLTYFDMRPIQERMPLRFEELKEDPYNKQLEKMHETFVPKLCANLFRKMMSLPRYRESVLLAYEHLIEPSQDLQFGALAIQAGERIVIGFEGTDLSYVGWKEDCIMSYSDSIASYQLAKAFTEKVMERFPDKKVILAGHSKGGNVAAYVLSALEDDTRIEAAYSFEGPGFHSSSIFAAHPEREKKLFKYIPQSSVVGVLLCNETNVRIVKSRSVGIFQHNTFKWQIIGDDFVYLSKRSMSSRYIDKAVNGWIATLSEDERRRFVRLVFNMLDNSKARDFRTLVRGIFMEMPTLNQAYKQMGAEDKTFFDVALKNLQRISVRTFKEEALAYIKSTWGGIGRLSKAKKQGE